MPGHLTSAQGFISLLDEDQPQLKVYALRKLNEVVDEFWAEIADSLSKIEILYEDPEFVERELASLVASKVFYHLGDFNSAMHFALGAGTKFDVQDTSEYVTTILHKFIDDYIRKQGVDNSVVEIDPRHEAIVVRMFERCFESGSFKHALGIGLETHRLDMIERAIVESGDVENMLSYCLKVVLNLVSNIRFRHQALDRLATIYNSLASPDYISICRIYVFLDRNESVADLFIRLLKGSEDELLLAFQIAFDLCSNGTQQFLTNVRARLSASKPSVDSSSSSTGASDSTTPSEAMEVDESSPLVANEAATTTSSVASDNDSNNSEYSSRLEQLLKILSGEISITLQLEFLHRKNRSDLSILKNTKNSLDNRNSITHSALIFANALMHAGTTRDTFLRENLEWLSRATNWAKFSATAGLGVIHKGHLSEGRALLAPYLPRPGSSSPYSEGGALYALGIIHANHGEKISDFLVKSLNETDNEIIQHGACLGLGVAGMASGNEELYERLKDTLYLDQAVAGEAAGIGMGLVMLGTASDKVNEMIRYAHETQHEKIIRGLAIGIALIMYGQEEQADGLIEQLLQDKDPIMRYGGMYAIGLAYCGTANNDAIRRLLRVAVSDVSDDVRRAAVTCLGFLLSHEPAQCPRIVSLLADSYNPHVRYGAAMAIGIACAGTANSEAISLLLPLASDPVDFVKQGALVALAMVLIQASKAREPRVETVRKLFEEKIADKHEDLMAKFGAILGQGIMDAGGRNVTIALHSISRHKNMSGMVGLALFTQFWYWYPLIHFLSLAFSPTAIIALNKDLKVPKFQFKSNVRPSVFAYPPEIKAEVKAAPTKVVTAELSTTRKAKQKQAKKDEAKKEDAANDDTKKDEVKQDESKDTMETEDEEEKKKKPEQRVKAEPEPEFEILENPARVLPQQLRFTSFDVDARYQPISSGGNDALYGIVLLRDRQPELPTVLADASTEATTESSASSTSTTSSTTPSSTTTEPPKTSEADDLAPPPSFEYE